MNATLVQHDHDDLTVVNAARVSFAKESESLTDKDKGLIGYLAKHRHWTPFGHARFRFQVHTPSNHRAMFAWAGNEAARAGFEWEETSEHSLMLEGSLFGWCVSPPPLSDDVMRGIRYHLSEAAPTSTLALLHAFERERMDHLVGRFEPTSTTLRLTMPLFVARQWMRSNIGVVYNEESRRYVDHEPSFWEPRQWRARPTDGIKQGSGEPTRLQCSDQFMDRWGYFRDPYDAAVQMSRSAYEDLLAQGIAPEMARTCLPVSMMTELWMTATPSAMRRIIGLRDGSDGHPQKEIQDLAALVVEAMS